MKRNAGIFIFCIVLSCFVYQTSARTTEYKIENLSLQQGVSQNLIFTIYQDSKGFIWYGTMFGLVRYDGYNYMTFRYDPADTNSLSNDDVISIYEDSGGYLWIGTYRGGLNKYDRKTGHFTRYLHNERNAASLSENTVWSIFQDKSSVMWFGTEGGLNKLENGKFKSFRYDSTNTSGIGANVIYGIVQDKKGNLWIATAFGGLDKMDIANNTFTIYKRDTLSSNAISGNFIRSLYLDNDGIIWAGSMARGLNSFNPLSGEFKKYVNDKDDLYSISDNSILNITGEGTVLWVATAGGVNKFDKSTGKFERLKLRNDVTSDDPDNAISLCLDKSGILWVSLYNNGLYKLFGNQNKFITYTHQADNTSSLSNSDVLSVYEDSGSKLWVGTKKGLNKFNDSTKYFISYLNNPEDINSISNNTVNAICEDPKGNFWIGTANGLNIMDRNKNIFRKITDNNIFPAAITSGNITVLYESKDKSLWIGTIKGLYKLNPEQNKVESFTHKNNDSSSINEDYILSIFEDSQNTIWAGTYTGLNKLDNTSGNFRHYSQNPYDANSLSNNYAFSFAEDAEKNLWIGTGGGLNKLDKQTGNFTYFTEKDGLPNSVISGLETDKAGNLWISTHKGISKFDMKSRTFRNYDLNDGLQSNLFNTHVYCKRNNGEIIFGGPAGFSAMNPAEISESKFIPPLSLTTLIKYRDNFKDTKDLSGTDEIELSYKDNIFEIQFASLDFTNPQKNQYAYMLEGFEYEWEYAGNSTKALYTNINPGTYTFKVKGTNSDGVWNETGASLKVVITPPFWNTWWFYLLVVVCVITLGAASYNYRIKQQVKALLDIEIAKEIERENVREQASRDYHDELGHKLTRISIYTRRIRKKLGINANGLSKDLENIVDTSNSLQSGAKDLIWALNPQEDSLYDLAVRIKDFGNSLFESSSILFTMNDVSERFRDVRLSMNTKRHLIYIFKEGMNNVLKYAECRNVLLEINYENNIIRIVLKDDGIGFENCDNIKGYGLKNIASRTKQINGNVEIISGKNSGTTIKVSHEHS